MDKQTATRLIEDTFNRPFDENQFRYFAINLLNEINEAKAFPYLQGQYVKDSFKNHVRKYRRLGTYTDPSGEKVDVLIVHLKNPWALERSRTMLRNFAASYLKNRDEKDAALIAYHTDDKEDWRFSFVRMEYRQEITEAGKIKVREELTPARRYSFLVGENEPNHTAQQQIVPILRDDRKNPTISDIEKAFSVDAVTKQFYTDYRRLFEMLTEELDDIIEKDAKIKTEFEAKSIDTANFAKKLLGQIVFLYFLQKKGWLGITRNERGDYDKWGSGPKDFMGMLLKKQYGDYQNFFNDVLEYLFYEALATERPGDIYSSFNCKIPFLNGGLFEPMNDYNWQETDIRIYNDLFIEILDTFDRYNFTVREDEPLEKEVAVDPEMLGKVFENLLPENLRKGKGTYYTPRTIVHYMCQESLINYLDTAVNQGEIALAKIPPEQKKLFGKPDPVQASLKTTDYKEVVPQKDIELFVHKGEEALEYEIQHLTKTIEKENYYGDYKKPKIPDSIKEYAKLIDEKLAGIKVCDPAVGSGAFPVGMLNEIVKARSVLIRLHNKDYELPIGVVYNLKRHCIQESLYGVDIDPGAIDIAKLRLWLSLVVDEDDYHIIQPLPNLDYKIMQGNSLLEEFSGISLDIEKKQEQLDLYGNVSELDKLIEELHQKQNEFFNATHPGEKQKRKQDVEQAIFNIFHHEIQKKKQVSPNEAEEIEMELREMTHGNKPRKFFPWKLYFADVFREKGGFDVVIANPPYIRLQKSLDDGTNNKFADLYKDEGLTTFKRTGDIYALFYEMGINVLKEQGHLVYITSNKWMRADYGDVLRGFFAKHNPAKLLDLGGFKVFESATVDTNIIVLQKSDNQNKTEAVQFQDNYKKDDSVHHYFDLNKVNLENITSDTWFIGSKAEIILKQKIETIGTPLKEWDVRINSGIKTGCNEAFIIDETKRTELIAQDPNCAEVIKPILRGRDIKRYSYDFAGLYLIDSHNGYNENGNRIPPIIIDNYPAIKNHLDIYLDKISIRQDKGITPYNLRNCAYYSEFEKEKMVWIELVDDGRFTYAEPNIFINNNPLCKLDNCISKCMFDVVQWSACYEFVYVLQERKRCNL